MCFNTGVDRFGQKMKNKINVLSFIFLCIAHNVYCADSIMETPKTIIADKIEYNVKSSEIKTIGKTEISNINGQKLTLTDISFSNKESKFSGQDIQLWLGEHVYIESGYIERNGDETIANDAMFTACDGCDTNINAWEITSNRINHVLSDNMLYFHNSVLWFYNLPVFWLPYWEMADPTVKYKSGLLMPDFSSTNKMGTLINLPVYISISDTQDATFTFGYLTQENPLFQLEHRLNAPHSEFRTNSSFTHNKDGDNRWHIFNNDVIEFGDNMRSTVFLERASDKTYLQKYGFYDARPYLDSGARIELYGQSSYAVADAHVFQELRSARGNQSAPDGDILPNIHGIYQTDTLFGETYAKFYGDILGVAGGGTATQRFIGDARIVSPWILGAGNKITLSLDTRYDIYNFYNTDMLNRDNFSGIKTRFLPSGYVEWELPFVKTGTKWTHVIEPRARLTVMRRTDEYDFAKNNDSAGAFLSDTTLFSDNRFPGYDLWENGTFADYGMHWAMFDSNGQTIEFFAGQSYDFSDVLETDRNSGFHNGLSDYVGRVGFNNSKWFDVSSRFRFAESDMRLRHIETNARIGNSHNYVNIGHMWSQQLLDTGAIERDIHEVIGGIGIRLTTRLSTRFHTIYNIDLHHFQSHSGGLFYEHPCYYLALEYHRDGAVNPETDYVGNTTYQFKFNLTY